MSMGQSVPCIKGCAAGGLCCTPQPVQGDLYCLEHCACTNSSAGLGCHCEMGYQGMQCQQKARTPRQ